MGFIQKELKVLKNKKNQGLFQETIQSFTPEKMFQYFINKKKIDDE